MLFYFHQWHKKHIRSYFLFFASGVYGAFCNSWEITPRTMALRGSLVDVMPASFFIHFAASSGSFGEINIVPVADYRTFPISVKFIIVLVFVGSH